MTRYSPLSPSKVTNEQLLAEIEDVIRSKPTREAMLQHTDDIVEWTSRAAAAICRWDSPRQYSVDSAILAMQTLTVFRQHAGFSTLLSLLYQARADLRLEVDPLSVVIPEKGVFAYFEELRKVIEIARSDLLFVDPYLDADFVSRYLCFAPSGVAIRLLGQYKMSTLLPSVEMFVQESGKPVEVRRSKSLHDRLLFVDKCECYLSGASFKDGPKNAPATLTRITDSFEASLSTYEGLWSAAKVERQ